jgi:VanZ family protein
MVSGRINLKQLISLAKPYSRYMLVIWAVIIMIVSSIPSIPTLRISAGGFSIRLDYITHVAIYVILAFLGYLSFTGRDLLLSTKKLLLITLSLMSFAFVDEFHQKYIPGRTFNLIDLISNVTGIFAALAFCWKIFGNRGNIRGRGT